MQNPGSRRESHLSKASQEVAVSLPQKPWCVGFSQCVRAHSIVRWWPGSPQKRLPKQEPQLSSWWSRDDVISVSKWGGGLPQWSIQFCSFSLCGWKSRPREGKALLKGTRHSAGRAGAKARSSQPAPVFPPWPLTTAGLAVGCELNRW